MIFVFNDTITAESDSIGITAGTMVVIPSEIALDGELRDFQPRKGNHESLPEYLLVCAGQSLKRDNYPGWNSAFEGGFYDFTLPNLVDRFIVGFDADGKPIMGTGCIYWHDIPEKPALSPRDIRQMKA